MITQVPPSDSSLIRHESQYIQIVQIKHSVYLLDKQRRILGSV
jgi:hypothetical protein